MIDQKTSVDIMGFMCFFAVNPNEKSTHSELDLREEYANAFRTESYNVFWERVVALTKGKSVSVTQSPLGSTTAARLSSYRIFVEHLLDPDQPTVTRILDSIQISPKIQSLLSDYFLETSNASFLCSHLLKDVDQTRIKYKSLKSILDSLQALETVSESELSVMLTRLTEFSNFCNPFVSSDSSPNRIQETQAKCSDLLKRLELKRDKTRAKLKLIHKLKNGSTMILVALTFSLTVVVALHALAVLLAAPGLVVASFELASAKKLLIWSAQLDAAAKGTYILMRDFDTISRLVGRLNDELEHMHCVVRFWLERGADGIQAIREVARQLKLNDTSFSEQLDELEEHLYLCFMTVNRARNLVLKEILNPPNILSSIS